MYLYRCLCAVFSFRSCATHIPRFHCFRHHVHTNINVSFSSCLLSRHPPVNGLILRRVVVLEGSWWRCSCVATRKTERQIKETFLTCAAVLWHCSTRRHCSLLLLHILEGRTSCVCVCAFASSHSFLSHFGRFSYWTGARGCVGAAF